MSPWGKEELQSSNAQIAIKSFEATEAYGMPTNNMVVIVSDNCNIGRAMSQNFNFFFVGCQSLQFKLADRKFLDNHTKSIEKVQAMMYK